MSKLLDSLVNELGYLPGIGPKSAARIAYYLIKTEKKNALRLAELIKTVIQNLNFCQICGNFTENVICKICDNPQRDNNLICVVEDQRDLNSIEKTGDYKGVYHILMGVLNPIEGVGPDNLRINDLLKRIQDNHPDEIILATNPNVEGEATAIYLSQLLKPLKIKITRLAIGLPIGSHLEYADRVTLANALTQRKEWN